MKAVLAALVLLATSAAHADGFRCQTKEGDLNIRIYNETNGATRNASVMVLSDPFVQHGNKTIAVFRAENSVLGQTGARYVANVDLRYNESGRGGENVGGTKLRYLKHIVVDLDFNYARPVAGGSMVQGIVTFLKRDGGDSFQEVVCHRYLKGE